MDFAGVQGGQTAGRGLNQEVALPVDPGINGAGAGIAVRTGDDALREKFNKAIDAIRANGKYKAVQDKYFKFDVYGEN